MISTYEVYTQVFNKMQSQKEKNQIIDISLPVLRKKDTTLKLAFFVLEFNSSDLHNRHVTRPTKYIIVNWYTGEIEDICLCTENDFSDESYDKLYNSTMPELPATFENYNINSQFQLLDEIREDLHLVGCLSCSLYKQYMDSILSIVPEDFCKFYKDLSMQYD